MATSKETLVNNTLLVVESTLGNSVKLEFKEFQGIEIYGEGDTVPRAILTPENLRNLAKEFNYLSRLLGDL